MLKTGASAVFFFLYTSYIYGCASSWALRQIDTPAFWLLGSDRAFLSLRRVRWNALAGQARQIFESAGGATAVFASPAGAGGVAAAAGWGALSSLLCAL